MWFDSSYFQIGLTIVKVTIKLYYILAVYFVNHYNSEAICGLSTQLSPGVYNLEPHYPKICL